ncbi:MAG TPA: DUF2877 domain-containing protein [Candidatus Dormibacteraeota bacterium]|nr:DUF2877 domain-containing protein [Candidatus Dormibacteraeota bacterium]
MNALSHSTSRSLEGLLHGPLVRGSVLSRAHLQFGDYVVSLTRPGEPRMPNGIECAAEARLRDRVAIGGGRLVIGHAVVKPGPGWNPVPDFHKAHVLPPGPEPIVLALAGLGPGLTPAGDDVLAGYAAGLVLLHGQRKRAEQIANQAAARTNSLSATLLRHAAQGEVPEVVHILLATGDARPLLAFGHSSGQAWLRGLVSAGYAVELEGSSLSALRLAGEGRR